MNTTMDKDSLGTLLMDDPGGDDTMDNKDKSDDDPPLSDKVNLDGSSTNDNPGSRDFNTPKLLASSNTKASRFSFSLVDYNKANREEGTASSQGDQTKGGNQTSKFNSKSKMEKGN